MLGLGSAFGVSLGLKSTSALNGSTSSVTYVYDWKLTAELTENDDKQTEVLGTLYRVTVDIEALP